VSVIPVSEKTVVLLHQMPSASVHPMEGMHIQRRMSKRPSISNQLAKEFKTWSTEQGITSKSETIDLSEYRSICHFVASKAVRSKVFNYTIMITILMNVITMMLQTLKQDTTVGASSLQEYYDYFEELYLAIYTIEFLLKFYVDLLSYFASAYNRVDALVLFSSYLSIIASSAGGSNTSFSTFRMLRALRALRALRSISFIRPLQVIVSALIKTAASIVNLLLLLILIMVLFAMMGNSLYGQDNSPDNEWNTFFQSMNSLWVYVTLDSWTDIQQRLAMRNHSSSVLFTVVFIFIGNFIITNLFIAVVVENLDEAQSEERTIREFKRAELFNRKKAFLLNRQNLDLENLMAQSQAKVGGQSFDDFLKSLAGSLTHDDITPVKSVCCSKMWLQTYNEALTFHQRNLQAKYMIQNEIAYTLHEVMEKRLGETMTRC